jgi:ubiquinone/menaquinone biosynthesis C-methylase UbiE
MADQYYLGHSPLELERLKIQAAVLKPVTMRLMKLAGLKPGHNVLDLGCGAGDVSLLASEIVGPSGSVTGIDASLRAVEFSSDRVAKAGINNVKFHVSAVENFQSDQRFDLVIGRYVLMHQPRPLDFLKAARSMVKTGGALAFHEVDMLSTFQTLPAVPIYDVAMEEVMRAIGKGCPYPDMARRLASVFAEAGLAAPQLFCERHVGSGRETNIHRWAAALSVCVRSLEHPDDDPGDIDQVEKDFGEATVAVNSQIAGPAQYCAWVAL